MAKPRPSVFREVASRLGVPVAACVMVGDRQVDDVSGALAVRMRAIWKRTDAGYPTSDAVPTATIERLAEIPPLLRAWGGS